MRLGWAAAVVAMIAGLGCGGVRAYEQHSTFLASESGVRRFAEVDALPIVGRLRGGQTEMVIRGHLTRRAARRVMRISQRVYDDVHRRFFDSRRQLRAEPVDVCVFFSKRRFDKFVYQLFGDVDLPDYGFYLADHRLLVVNLSRSIGNLRHELVHPLLRDDYPEIPTWLNEGLASLYGTASHRTRGYSFLVDYRLRDLHRAHRAGYLPTLDGLASSGYDDVHGRYWRAYYALGRYLGLYLERRGRLASFYRRIKASDGSPGQQRALLRANVDYPFFLTWVRHLR